MLGKISSIYFKRALNLPLLIGTAVLILLLAACVYPEYLYPADPYGMQRIEYTNENNASSILTPPIPPGKDYPWGTDELGRDMKSLVIYGTKQTIYAAFLAALLRLFIALPIAFMAGYENKLAQWLIKIFNIIFSAIPLLIAVIMFSSIDIFNFLVKDKAVKSIVWMVLLGWGRFAHLLSEKVKEILKQDFIEGEISIGKSRFEIAFQNVLPHIIPSIVVLFFLEVAMVLVLMTQVGLLGLAFGGGYYKDTGERNVPVEFDWASLLKFSYLLFESNHGWLVTFPAAAFAVSIIGFNLFGEGLRLEFDKRSSKVITFIKKLPGFFSVPKLIYELRSPRDNKRNLTLKATVYLLILAILFVPPFPSRYQFNAENSMVIVKELSDVKYQGRRSGSEGGKMAAEYIAGLLKSYGVKPLGEDYIQSFDIPVAYNIKGGELKVNTLSGEQILLENRKDFWVQTPKNLTGRLNMVDLTPEDYKNMSFEKYMQCIEGVVLFDMRTVDPDQLYSYMVALQRRIFPKVLLLAGGWDGEEKYRKWSLIDKGFEDSIVIMITDEKADELKRYKNLTVDLDIESEAYINAKGYNVLGYIPGSNPEYADQCIVLGCAIDHIGDDKDQRYPGSTSASAIAMQLEIARVMAKYQIKPEKAIIFGFWDGSISDYRGSKEFKLRYINKNDLKTFYIELTNMAAESTEKIMLDTSKTIPKSKVSQDFIYAFKNIARQKDVPIVYSELLTKSMDDFLGPQKEAVILGSDGVAEYINIPAENSDIISKKRLGQYGQVILDTIIEVTK